MLEATLIAAARLGDEDAFTELYQQHAGYVCAIGRSILRSPDLEDFCQDTFLLAFTRLHTFTGGSSFRSWITRIAINQGLIALRRNKQASNGACHLVQLADEPNSDTILDRCVFATEDAELRGVAARLDLSRLLRVLPAQQRRALEMAYMEGIPDVEIAEALGVSHTALKSTLSRGKQRMRKLFEGQ